MDRKEVLIEQYFNLGLQQKEILVFLKNLHQIDISQRTLKRILRQLSLYRKKHFTNIQDVVKFLKHQLSTSGQMHGYRWMHLKCLQNGLIVTQKMVRELLQLLDPVGIEFRRKKRLRRRQYSSRGPNYLWHMDSYDKLKRYGICINGCIDGFSRHIIWLRAGCTSNDPKVIAGYYLDSIKILGGCPRTVRSDYGTENGVVATLQTVLVDFFKEDNNNNHKSAHIYGRSTSNQRIESWWSILRKHNAQYWINVFEFLRDEGLFNGTYLDKSIVQFCFMEIIQDELDEVAFEWNTHKIRGSKNCISPPGRPMCLFELPELYGANNYLVCIPNRIADVIREDRNIVREIKFCDEDVFNLCKCLILEKGLTKDHDPYNAINLYCKLRSEINCLLENTII